MSEAKCRADREAAYQRLLALLEQARQLDRVYGRSIVWYADMQAHKQAITLALEDALPNVWKERP